MSIDTQCVTIHCMTNLGDYIKARREALGFDTQLAFAKMSGVPSTTINRLETGVSKGTSAHNRRRIAAALRVRHVDLLIAAGELIPEEVDGVESSPPFPAGSPAARVIAEMATMSDAQIGHLIEAIALLRKVAGEAAAISTDRPKPQRTSG